MKYFFLCLVLFFSCSQAQESDLSLKRSFSKDSLHLDLVNYTYSPIEVTLTPKDSMKDKINVQKQFVIQPLDTIDKVLNIPITLIKDTTSISITPFVDTYTVYGNPKNIKHDDSYLYSLPFKKDKFYRINQSFNGSFTHNSIQSKYAIDFGLKKGEPIYAARDGIVVKTIEKFKKSGGRELINQANKIIIMHNDGTYASYVHLKYKGVLVESGQRVKRGQKIGYSGNTGFSRGPHLHFVVRKERDISIPIYFEGYKGKVLKKGNRYKRIK